MHVGMAVVFQGTEDSTEDREVYRSELRLADLAEPLGFQSVWGVEHHFTSYTMCPDVLQFLTYVAGRTRSVQLGSMVVVLPWHDPIRVAEQVTMLDHLSDGRMILGLGRGLGRVEFEGFRVAMDESRPRFIEASRMILQALESGTCEFEGEFYKLPACRSYPKPVQSPHPPLFFGGESTAALRRVADFGKGWYGFNLEPDEIEPHVEALDKLLSDRGRSRDEVEIAISPYLRRPTRALVEGYRDAGVDQLILLLPTRDVATTRDVIQQMADDLL